jgi:hypothetical protein
LEPKNLLHHEPNKSSAAGKQNFAPFFMPLGNYKEAKPYGVQRLNAAFQRKFI